MRFLDELTFYNMVSAGILERVFVHRYKSWNGDGMPNAKRSPPLHYIVYWTKSLRDSSFPKIIKILFIPILVNTNFLKFTDKKTKFCLMLLKHKP